MFRIVLRASASIHNASRNCLKKQAAAVTSVRYSHGGKQETDAEFDQRYVDYFSKKDIDGWEIRKGMNDLTAEDLIPEPKIIIAAMHACRRVNDHSLAVRYLESVQWKCGNAKDKIWPWLHQEIKPTLDELGISTPEDMGYDKPELYLEKVENM